MRTMTVKMRVVRGYLVMCCAHTLSLIADSSIRISARRHHGIIRFMSGSLLSRFQLQQKKKTCIKSLFFLNNKSKARIGLVPKDEGALSGDTRAELHSRAGADSEKSWPPIFSTEKEGKSHRKVGWEREGSLQSW